MRTPSAALGLISCRITHGYFRRLRHLTAYRYFHRAVFVARGEAGGRQTLIAAGHLLEGSLRRCQILASEKRRSSSGLRAIFNDKGQTEKSEPNRQVFLFKF